MALKFNVNINRDTIKKTVSTVPAVKKSTSISKPKKTGIKLTKNNSDFLRSLQV
jgi:hypothetical protein